VRARFSLDGYSGKYDARIAFRIEHRARPDASSIFRWCSDPGGISVTDLKWRALGRAWLGEGGGRLELRGRDLCERLRADMLYLTLGLSRAWRGRCWPLVVGVHAVPDFTL
jgi:hypothetical protein